MKTGTILIVDDNKSVLASLELLLETQFSRIVTASNPNQIASLLSTLPINVVILDMNFSTGISSGNEGLYWLEKIRRLYPLLPVIMLTAYGDVELAVKALKNGATDFLLKPWENDILVKKVNDAYLKQKTGSCAPPHTGESKNGLEMLVGNSHIMLKLMKIVAKVARTDANILITGENGTGKEVLAREIHRLSQRSTQQMLSVDMGAISESLFESELFGHERGAFTDAFERRPGKFEAASGSTLFMDEIGNLPLPLQAKLLTVLQNRKITRLGSNEPVAIDIRLVCATNKDMPEMVKAKQFREDLYYRINTIHLEIPPLRQRGDDILLFIDTFLKKFAAKYQKQGMQIQQQTIEKLREYHWPGNIRELQHTIEKAVILCEGNLIRPRDIMVQQTRKVQVTPPVQNLEEIERQAIEAAISQNDGNLTAAAHQLGVSRQTLYNKLKRFKS